jgi:hypothetical protein
MDVCSGGRLAERDIYGKPSGQDPFRLDAFFNPAATSASFCTTITHGGDTVAFTANDYGHEAIYRTIACLLIWRMPSDGLRESIESLSEIRSHYMNLLKASNAPKISTTFGRAGDKTTRPKLELPAE